MTCLAKHHEVVVRKTLLKTARTCIRAERAAYMSPKHRLADSSRRVLTVLSAPLWLLGARLLVFGTFALQRQARQQIVEDEL